MHSVHLDSRTCTPSSCSHVMSSAAVSSALRSLKRTLCLDIQSVYPGGGRVPIPARCSLLKDGVGLNMRLIEEVCQDTVTGMLIVRVSEDDAFKELLAKVEKGKKVYGWTAGVEVTTVYLHNVLVQAGPVGDTGGTGKVRGGDETHQLQVQGASSHTE